uniref:Uncharacterized protein n=1 Tax=Arundo donax TaxID=35708 RepID=A0A0A9H650_ARUDO
MLKLFSVRCHVATPCLLSVLNIVDSFLIYCCKFLIYYLLLLYLFLCFLSHVIPITLYMSLHSD